MAQIGWIDFSPKDRSRVGSVLDLLTPEGMVDELGLGTIRDSISNHLFPGISTIQTKAKYFFIIPYILRDYSKLKPAERRTKKAFKYLEEKEYEIMWYLAAKYNYELGSGVIGVTKRKPQKIMRRPSAIYWTGLNTYKFIDADGLSLEDYLNQVSNFSAEPLLSTIRDDEEDKGDDKDADFNDIFKIKVPDNPNWKDDLSLNLSEEEAQFFEDHINKEAKENLISELINNKKLWELFSESNNFMDFSKASVLRAFSKHEFLPANIKDILILSHDFSQLMNGAHITYNYLLQKEVFNKDYFEDDWEKWLGNIHESMIDFNNFDEDKLFNLSLTTRITTIDFVRKWLKMVRNNFNNFNERNELIVKQEALVKGSKARLKWGKFDDVREGKWMGIHFFNYRFFQAKTILKDIKKAL